LFQLAGRAESLNLPVHHDGYSVAILGFIHIMSGHENGYSAPGCIVNQLPKLSACGGGNTAPADAKATGPVVIVDLRSAEEFKKGHLEGAVNYDFSSGDFSSQISGLDRSSQYQLYGSADQPKMASAVMRNAGFSGVTELGTLDTAKKTTGAKVVTG